MMTLQDARELYEGMGFDTIPLYPGGKNALRACWQNRDPWRQWRDAPQDANLGLRGGGEAQIAFLDCDEKKQPGTFDHAVSWLAGLGCLPGDYPLVQTASGIGRHVYVTFTGGLPGAYRSLSPNFGVGEFRYGPGAYVVAPPSLVDDGVYSLLGGDYRQLPRLALVDVLPILANQDLTPEAEHKQPNIPRHALALLNGKSLENYKSRSEAEHSLIASLVNAGHSFVSVRDLFTRYPCAGKFAELRAKSEMNAISRLKHSYDKVVQWTSTHESKARQEAAAALQWAESTPWPGRTGAVDREVFIAHCQIAYRAGQLVYAASCRDLAELAGTSRETASIATGRLEGARLLTLVTSAIGDSANIYKMASSGQNLTLPHSGVIRKCQSLSHDVFRHLGLGKSAGEVWQVLQDGPATAEELAATTGRHIKTVKRALEKMSRLLDTVTGEKVPMVEPDGDLWKAVDVDLDFIASLVGTAGAGERQRKNHKAERRAHRRALELGRKAAG